MAAVSSIDERMSGIAVVQAERRAHQRLALRLPVECRVARGGEDAPMIRTLTLDVCTGGMQVAARRDAFRVGDAVEVSLTLPVREGVSASEGRINARGEVVRVSLRGGALAGEKDAACSVALRFVEPLRMDL